MDDGFKLPVPGVYWLSAAQTAPLSWCLWAELTITGERVGVGEGRVFVFEAPAFEARSTTERQPDIAHWPTTCPTPQSRS